MESIKLWLNSARLYQPGVRLYKQYGKDPLLLKSFEESESDFKKKKLVKALQDLLSGTEVRKETVQRKENELIEKVKPVQMMNGWPKQMDGVLGALYNEWKPKFMAMQDLCTRLWDVAMDGESDEMKKMEAGAICFQVVKLDDDCDAIYAKRDFYIKNNRMPDEPAAVEIVSDPAHQWREYNNVMRYIRHYKKKIDEKPDKVQFQVQLKKYESAAVKYKQILGL